MKLLERRITGCITGVVNVKTFIVSVPDKLSRAAVGRADAATADEPTTTISARIASVAVAAVVRRRTGLTGPRTVIELLSKQVDPGRAGTGVRFWPDRDGVVL